MIAPDDQRIAVIIEDDADVRNLLKTVLTQSGFETVLASNGFDGVEAVKTHQPVITTLDVSMPGMDGLATAKRIREFSSTYIIMLTAMGEEIDIVQGLGAGADDYLVKPFRPRELRARVESIMRRPRFRDDVPGVGHIDPAPQLMTVGAVAPVPPVETPQVVEPMTESNDPEPMDSGDGWIRFKGIELSVERRIVKVDGAPVELTRSEFDLLSALLSSGRRVRSKADLVLTLHGESYVTAYFVNDADKRAVEVHMANLRRKIGDSSSTPRWIETVRGVGYRLTSDD